MGLIWCLIAVPLITAALLLVFKDEQARRPITIGGAAVTAAMSVLVAAQTFTVEAGTCMPLQALSFHNRRAM